ncbi:hypothetical protein [Aliivibrio fischeri]
MKCITRYMIGVFPSSYDEFPWHCHYEDGLYLSKKHRVCMWKGKEAIFSTKEEAIDFFNLWKNPRNFNYELIEFEN